MTISSTVRTPKNTADKTLAQPRPLPFAQAIHWARDAHPDGRKDRAMTWTADQLARIGDAEELRLASRRADGTLRSFTTMWVVRADGELYVRSAGGPQRPWYRHALASRRGSIRAGGIEADVGFAEVAADAQAAIDAAYHAKYDRYGPAIVGHVTGPAAHAVTVRLQPAGDKGESQ